MTPGEATKVVEAIELRHTFRGARLNFARADSADGYELQLSIKTIDVETGNDSWVYRVELFDTWVLTQLTPERFVERIRWSVIAFVEHEVDECLYFEGRHVREPHPELKKSNLVVDGSKAEGR